MSENLIPDNGSALRFWSIRASLDRRLISDPRGTGRDRLVFEGQAERNFANAMFRELYARAPECFRRLYSGNDRKGWLIKVTRSFSDAGICYPMRQYVWREFLGKFPPVQEISTRFFAGSLGEDDMRYI